MEVQTPVLHWSSSHAQEGAAPGVQVPARQVSPAVQPEESASQGADSWWVGSLTQEKVLLPVETQTPVLHWSSSQTQEGSGPARQRPALQVSSPVQPEESALQARSSWGTGSLRHR